MRSCQSIFLQTGESLDEHLAFTGSENLLLRFGLMRMSSDLPKVSGFGLMFEC